jgi:hypothetical protein
MARSIPLRVVAQHEDIEILVDDCTRALDPGSDDREVLERLQDAVGGIFAVPPGLASEPRVFVDDDDYGTNACLVEVVDVALSNDRVDALCRLVVESFPGWRVNLCVYEKRISQDDFLGRIDFHAERILADAAVAYLARDAG